MDARLFGAVAATSAVAFVGTIIAIHTATAVGNAILKR